MPELSLNYDYGSLVRTSERVSWTVDEVLPEGTELDFTKPFLPQVLAPTAELSCLSESERLTLNHISGHAYLNLFAFIEEYIIATACRHAEAEMFGDHDALRALMRFADEELKHQQLFARYLEAFKRGFGHDCEVLTEPASVAMVIMSKSPIAVMLITLHLEIMTQAHYVECVKESDVDPLFARLLKYHWIEEAQHAKIDALELQKQVAFANEAALERAVDDYLDVINAMDELLGKQSSMDVASLQKALGRQLSAEDAEEIRRAQHRGLQRSFLTYGMEHRQFLDLVAEVTPDGADRIIQRAKEFS